MASQKYQQKKHLCQASLFLSAGGCQALRIGLRRFFTGVSQLASCYCSVRGVVTSQEFCLICISIVRRQTHSLNQCSLTLSFTLIHRQTEAEGGDMLHPSPLAFRPIFPLRGEKAAAFRMPAGAQQMLLHLRHEIEAIRCFLQVLWSCCLVWIASSGTSRMLSVVPPGEAVGPGQQPPASQQPASLSTLPLGREGNHSTILNALYKSLK